MATLKEQLEDIANRLGEVVNALQAIAAAAPGTPPEPEPEPEPSPATFTVRFKPTGIIRGVLRGPESETPVELIGSKPIVFATFYLDGTRTNVDGNPTNGYGPWFDSRTISNGKHIIRAVAVNEEGEEAEAMIEVEVQNGIPAPVPDPRPTSGPLIHVDASEPYTAQRDWQASGVGKYIQPAYMPLRAADGSNRIAFVDDPLGANGKVIGIALHERDPRTSGSPRTEISCSKNLVPGEAYWVGLRVLYLDENIGRQPGLFGCQCHAGDTTKGYSPSFAIIHDGSNTRNFKVRALWVESSGSKYAESPSRPIPFGKWSDFVFCFREDLEGDGICQVWQDGDLFFNHSGKLGFPQRNINSYMKFGLYFWNGLTSQRRLYLKNPCIFLDDGHEQEDIRAFINS